MRTLEAFLIFIYLCLLLSCASSEDKSDYHPPIHPAAYTVMGFTWEKKPPQHERKNWEFYYKHCDVVGYNSYYSRSQYECSDPF